ncbi:UNVERIFIED_CONTAM: hypothetical protein HDU68_004261 [Siphonaria sp. JEL0065]|nr:hypothetical protein HDU68_004261 [Siphonaria sp. JEL0065]
MNSSSSLRLVRDFADLTTAPLSFASAAPVSDSNIFEWHANLLSPKFSQAPLHVKLVFPANYPSAPPSVWLFGSLPHANVLRDTKTGLFKICLDMLETGVYADHLATSGGTFAYSGWSSSYSVKSILMQLQSFLLDVKIDESIRVGTIAHARQHAEHFECSGCFHKPGQPWPSVQAVVTTGPPIYIERPFVKDLLEIAKAKKVASQRDELAAASKFVQYDADGFEFKVGKSRGGLKGASLPMDSQPKKIVAFGFGILGLEGGKLMIAEASEKSGGLATPGGKRKVLRIVTASSKKSPSTPPALPVVQELEVAKLQPVVTVESIITLSEASRFFYIATQDGYLWRHLFNSMETKLELKGASIGDWKHVYEVQMNGVVQDLSCFHRKTSFRDDVLGIPVEFTVNPVKGTVDYIHSTFDFLSHSAFKVDGIRKTVWSEKFSEWMPVFISYDHFQRSLPLLKKSLARLSPHVKSQNGFHPLMVLEVLPKLMNTQIVLLCDKGLHNSDAFLTNYFQIHRLFIALIYEFPQLKTLILARLNEFSRSKTGRTKEAVASLGDLIPLVAMLPNPSKTWKSIGPMFIKESFERNVLWICRHDPELANLDKPVAENGVDDWRIRETFVGSGISLKLWATHVALFEAISSYGSTRNMVKTHDLFYGRPPTAFLTRIKATLKSVLDASTFEDILPHYQLPTLPFLRPSYDAAKLTTCLRECVSESTKSVVMEGSWSRGGLSTYLDATVLMYGFDGEFMDLADFRQQSAALTAVKPRKVTTEAISSTLEIANVLDVVFIIDITGSMGSQIEGVKQMINSFFDTNDLTGMRIHIWTFTEGGDSVYVDSSAANLSPKELREYISKIKLCCPVGYPGVKASGDDGPENVVSAVANLSLKFKPTDNVLAFLITDASPHHRCMGASSTAVAEKKWLATRGFDTDIYQVLAHVIETLNVTLVPILFNTYDIMWYQQAAVLTGGMCLNPQSTDSKLLSTGLVHILKTMQEISVSQSVSDKLADTTSRNLRGFNMIPVSAAEFIPLAVDPEERDRLVQQNATPTSITPTAIMNLLKTAVSRFSFNGAIRHSGDIVSGGRGSHRITIDMKNLPDNVQSLVFALSSWTATLKDVLDPEVRLFDGASLTELCRYGFDDCATAGENTCVVMCRLKRERVGGLWNVDVLGKIGMGSALNYEPVKGLCSCL